MRTRCRISGSTSARNFELCQMCMHKRITQITSSNWSRDLDAIYRPDAGHVTSLMTSLHQSFVTDIPMTKFEGPGTCRTGDI